MSAERADAPDTEEPESPAASAARRRRQIRYTVTELSLACAFAAAVTLAVRWSQDGAAARPLMTGAVVAAILVLGMWLGFYFHWYRRLDEFERALEARAVAIAGILTVFGATAFGIVEAVFGAADFPFLALTAPAFAVVYSAARHVIAGLYR